MVDGVAYSYINEDNKITVLLANGKSLSYENAKAEVKMKRLNVIKSIISIIVFSLISFSIIYYLPPWKIYGLSSGLQFAFSLALFAILVASIYSIYISADSLRKFPVLVITQSDGKILEFLLIKGKDPKSKG